MARMFFFESFNMRTAETWTLNQAASGVDAFVMDGTNGGTLAFIGEGLDYAHGAVFGNVTFGAYTLDGKGIFGFDPEDSVGANVIQDLLQVGGSQAFFEHVLSGDDEVTGSDERDVLYGYDGDDTLWGFNGNDTLYGGQGRDFLHGGLGDDVLRGGGGTDYYVFDQKKDGIDTLADFNTSQDFIELYNGLPGGFNRLGHHGALKEIHFRANAGGNAEDATDRVLYDTVTGALYYDADANGAGAKVQIALIGIVDGGTLSADNFQVVTLA